MLNRRQLRIKVLQALYAYFQEEDRDMPKAERQLFFSIEKFFELYVHLLSIMQRVHQLRKEKMEQQSKRHLATDSDKNPNTRFVDNVILKEVEINKELAEKLESHKIQWDEDSMHIIRDVHTKMIESEEYKEYMSKETGTLEEDVKIVSDVFKQYVVNNELIQHYFDEMSIFWADDLDLAASMALKTLKSWKKVKEPGTGALLELYKDAKEESEFARDLFRKTIVQSTENEAHIDASTKNWDLDRIAYMDMLIMKMALAEARTFKSIPTKVTMNEYIELSKFYSTVKSSPFINGVLDKLFLEMKESGEIKKMGRGLLES
jgi:N utilization substance protein B